MKRLITILIGVFLTVTLSAQAGNTFKYEIKGLGGITIGPTSTANKATITSATVSNNQVSLFNGIIHLGIAVPASQQISGSTLYPELRDTIPLATFGAGAGLIADTALMNNGVLIGSFYNEGSDTLKITQLVGILKEGTGTETISVQISWHATFLSGSAVNLNSSALAITSMTTGTVDASFANSKIPPNVFVWGVLSGASTSNKPTFLNVTLSGYKIPKY